MSQEDVGQQEPQSTPQAPQSEPVVPVAPPEPVETGASIDAKEIEEGKAFAVLSYVLSLIGLPFFLVPLIMRNNAFALFHAKQCLILWLAGLVVSVATVILSFVCIGLILGPVAGIALLVLCIIGLIGASKGEVNTLPLIGKYGEAWFKGIKKV